MRNCSRDQGDRAAALAFGHLCLISGRHRRPHFSGGRGAVACRLPDARFPGGGGAFRGACWYSWAAQADSLVVETPPSAAEEVRRDQLRSGDQPVEMGALVAVAGIDSEADDRGAERRP